MKTRMISSMITSTTIKPEESKVWPHSEPCILNEEILRIPEPACMIYTANFVESLVLLDGLNISSQSEN
ncbi:hypothetical protein CFP56_028891 [Quercus suber]|uniref:Uncharacterized protein n=1 Tax=Quercus suber TaxID=58331 RepID=A0AAW0JSQ0_QUESU